MTDVFLSYAHANETIAEKLAGWLKTRGFDVWTDKDIPAASKWPSRIERALARARAVVVLWSKECVDSEWVKKETKLALDQEKLVPVMIDDSIPPAEFKAIQVVNLIEWNGDPEDLQRTTLMEAIREHTGVMIAIIPTGGEGRSMFPLTKFMPKCLIPVGDQPILGHIIDSFLRSEKLFRKIIVATGDFPAMSSTPLIREELANGEQAMNFHPMISKYVNAKTHVSNCPIECRHIPKEVPYILKEIHKENASDDISYLLHYCDILLPTIDWEAVWERFEGKCKREEDCIGELIVSKTHNIGIGVINEGDTDYLESFEEKPKILEGARFANTGVSILRSALLAKIVKDDNDFFKDTLQNLRTRNPAAKIGLHKIKNWHHVHDLNDLTNAQKAYNTR